MEKNSDFAPLRRSSRVQVRIPVTLSGTSPEGKKLYEETFIVGVSKYGARLSTQLPLSMGTQLRISPKGRSESAVFEVVWVGQPNTPRAGEVGVQYVQVSNLLGITFPE